MSIQATIALALGNTPDLFPILNGGGLVSPSPQWGENPCEQTIYQARMIAFRDHGLKLSQSVWMAPQHSRKIRYVDSSNAGAGAFSREERIKCDALITTTPDLHLCGVAADCQLIVIEDLWNGVSALVHAGWVGQKKNIVPLTIKEMERYGAERENMNVFVGPFISAKNYRQESWGPKVQFFAEFGAMYEQNDYYHCCMETVMRKQLEASGISFDRTIFDGRCTYEHDELCSHVRTAETESNGFQRGSHVLVGTLPV